jgi:hypothetical protein
VPKLLPRWAYQLAALALLALVYGAAFDLSYRDVLPFRAVADVTGMVIAALLMLLGATFVWVLLVLPLRLISDAPAILPPPGTDLRAAYEKARADLQRQDTPEARRRYHARMMAAALALGLACAVGVALNLELMPERLFITPVAFVAACALLVPYHLVRAIVAR